MTHSADSPHHTPPPTWPIRALRGCLVVGVLVVLVVQVLALPWLAAETARANPDVTHLQYPVLALCIAILICAQVVAIAVWRLLALVEHGCVFSPDGLRWACCMTWAFVSASGLGVTLLVLLALQHTGHATITLLVLLGTGATVTLALLSHVLHGLLHRATTLEADLAEVI